MQEFFGRVNRELNALPDLPAQRYYELLKKLRTYNVAHEVEDSGSSTPKSTVLVSACR